MATPLERDGPSGRGFAPDPSGRDTLGTDGDGATRRLPPGGETADLRTLFSRLGKDVSQLAHDELSLAKMELRSVADTLSDDLRNAGKTMVKDLAKVGVAQDFMASYRERLSRENLSAVN